MSETGTANMGLLPLATRDLVYTVRGTTIIKSIDLDIRSPGVTMIMGPNGAGKSVLLRLLHGLLTPSGGSVSWNAQANNVASRRRQALVFQRPVLLRRSVIANIEYVLKLSGRSTADAKALLAQVGLADRARQPARQLSGGEQQRLALARALATTPEVLFMDEPTASLDPSSVLAIEQVAKAANASGTKIVWVTHDLGQAHRVADDIIFLNHGRITEHNRSEIGKC